MTALDFTDVTEMAGEQISPEQMFRLANRYYWAEAFITGKDVIEVACGTGPGLGYLAARANSLRSGDYSCRMVERVRAHYGDRIHCNQFDAQEMPFEENSADVIIIFEALYYLSAPEVFVAECKRVLRPGGCVLVSTANCDLFDFNPSPHSWRYHGVQELAVLFGAQGFSTEFWGSTPIAKVSSKQKFLRPLKKFMVDVGLMPKSMYGKQLLKRIIFGKSIPMPAEIIEGMAEIETPSPLAAGRPDTAHKVIYCVARL